MKKIKILAIPSTTNKCIRFPNDIIENVEEAIKRKIMYFYSFCYRSGKSSIRKFRRR